MQNGVESVYNVYLKHHPIKMGIQSGLNTMDHNLTTSSNYHPEVIWWCKWEANASQNYRHKALHISQYNVYSIAIGKMPP
jgi:hypothetical protein